MLYILKLLYAWLLPPGLFIVLSLLAIGLYLCSSSKRKLWLLLAPLLIYMLSIRPVAWHLQQPLENAYQQPGIEQLKDADAIVVLGGGSIGGVPDFDGQGQIASGMSNRLLMGLRLHNKLKRPIIISGGTVFSYAGTEADIGERVLLACGIKNKYIIKENHSRNTVENARYTKAICEAKGIKKVVLVTSAFHMPRSVLLFQRAGVDVVPYPTDYMYNKTLVYDAFAFTPNADNVYNISLTLKEYLGIGAIKLGLQ